MNVFANGGIGPDRLGMGMKECKRDLESEIKRAREQSSVSLRLKEAIEFYVFASAGYYDRNASFTLEGLYGALCLAILQQDQLIENLIAEQERESK